MNSRTAVRLIERFGGKVHYDSRYPSKQVVRWVDLRGTSFGDGDAWVLNSFFRIRWLDLRETLITNDGLEQIKDLTTLETLILDNTRIDDGGLVHLRGFAGLLHLFLNHTAIQGNGLCDLGSLVNLDTLSLGYTEVSDDAMKFLPCLNKLSSLGLTETRISDEAFCNIGEFPVLKFISVAGNALTNKTAKLLFEFKTLKSLNIENCKISCECFDLINRASAIERLFMDGADRASGLNSGFPAKMRALTSISLNDVNLLYSDFKQLSMLENLKTLDLNRTGIDDRALAVLDPLNKLIRICLYGNRITMKGICEFIEVHKYIKYIDISNTGIDNMTIYNNINDAFIKEKLVIKS